MSEKVNNPEKMGVWAKFMLWYDSYQGKKVVGMVYSIGATFLRILSYHSCNRYP